MEEVEIATEVVKHGASIWLKSLGWTFIGIAFVKAFTYPFGTATFKKWIVYPALPDIIRGFLFTLILIQLGDVILHLAEYIGFNVSKLETVFKELEFDPIRLSLAAAIVVQIAIHKWRKSKNNDS